MKVSIQELKVGTALRLDVTGPNGQLLLKSGVPLTEKHLRAFKMWGVTEVEIEGEEGDTGERNSEFGSEILAKADQVLQGRFFGADLSHPVLNKIYSICLNRLAREIMVKGEIS